MAASAVVSESSVMHVVAVVAIDAATTRGVHLVTGTRMTGYASKFFVRTIDHETGALVMIEIPDSPVARVVAGVTGRAKLSLMLIVLAVAAHARARGVPESLRRVAILARHFLVTSEQRKARSRMIEARRFPTRLTVTPFAARALLSGVNIVFAMARQAVGLEFLSEPVVAGMAGFALHLGMHAKKRIAGVLRMVESGDLPVRLQVAGFTTRAQRAAVNILFGVAAVARRRWFLFMQRSAVACVALDASMRIEQRKVCIAIMVENHFLPAHLRVAALAVSTEATLVDIVLLVTAVTSRRQFGLAQRRLVAGFALGAAMRIAQREVCVTLVIETYNFPFRLAMAALAFLAEAAVVHVLLAMASDASERRLVVEGRALVAIAAANLGMARAQREPGTRVVELPALPSGSGVAAIAVDTKLALVHVILAMAGNAGLRRSAVLRPGGVAVTAFNAGVQCEQHEVGERVIEPRLV